MFDQRGSEENGPSVYVLEFRMRLCLFRKHNKVGWAGNSDNILHLHGVVKRCDRRFH